MVRIITLFLIFSIVAIFLSATGMHQFDFQLEKISLVVLIVSAAFVGFLIGNLVSTKSS